MTEVVLIELDEDGFVEDAVTSSVFPSRWAPLWQRAMPDTDGLWNLNGMRASVAEGHLEMGICRMEEHPWRYREMIAEFDLVLSRLKLLREKCSEHSQTIVCVWR